MQLRFLLLSCDPYPRVGKQETVAQKERRKQSEGEELRRADAGRGDGEPEEAERETSRSGRRGSQRSTVQKSAPPMRPATAPANTTVSVPRKLKAPGRPTARAKR